MPRLRSPLVILWLLAGLALPPALAQPAGQPALPIAGALASRPDTPPSGLDAELFYQLLIAELQRRHDPGAAYSIILEAARRTGHPELFRRAMEIALQGRAPQAALSAVREWRQRLPADDEARRTELQLLLGLQRVREAGPVLRDWIRATPAPQRPALIAVIPSLLARASDKAEAVAAAQTALEPFLREAPTSAAAWAALGRVHRQAGDDEQALHAARQAIQADPRAAAGALLAVELLERRPEEAEPLVQRYLHATRNATDTDPVVAISYAQALAERGRMAEARAVLQHTRATRPDERRRLLIAEARLLRDQDQPQAAYDVLTQALRDTPDDPDLQYELAMVAERTGRLDEMERLLRAVIARKPDDAHAYNALGYALADRGVRLTEAKALIEEALRRAPDDAYIIDSLGWVEYRLGNWPEARRLLTQAMQQRPDAEIAAHLGEVLWMLGERDEALAVWRQGLALDARNRTLTETLQRLGVQP
jgi:tetratricopeptide (TPR) repeat protein